ncbi:MAG: hypothetical protein Q7J27_00485 [Syntrophales bacterium]|nr:hypothetical protein [Syntrophales bacterium]
MKDKPATEWFQDHLDKYKNDYCPLCQTVKVKRVRYYMPGKSQALKRFKDVSIDYELDAGESLISVYCPKCLIVFAEEK